MSKSKYSYNTYLSQGPWGFFIILLMITSPLAGQTIFEATVSQKKLPLNGTVQLTYTIKNGKNIKGFAPPDFNPFQSRGPSTSSQMRIVNGNVSKTESYIYTLTPTKKGKFTIPSATVFDNGHTLKSNKVQIEVTDAVSNPKGNQRNQRKNGNNQIDETSLAEGLYVKVIPSKTEAYKGEQITLKYKLYTKLNVRDIRPTKPPQFNGFLHRDIERKTKEQEVQQEVIDGEAFQTLVFREVALFPTKSGNLKIPPIGFKAEIIIREKDPFFGSGFFSRSKRYPYEFNSNSLNVNIKELPKPKPEGFTGGIGQFDYTVAYDKTETASNDPITLKLSVRGTGDIGLVKIPDLEFPSSIEVYEPKIKERVNTSNLLLSGSKTYEYLLIPRGGGDFKMDDIKLSHFDPKQEKYISRSFEGPMLKVVGEKLEDNPISANGVNKQRVDQLNNDIRYIQTGQIKNYNSEKLIGKWWFWILSFIPFLSLFAFPRLFKTYKAQRRIKLEKGLLAETHAIEKIDAINPDQDDVSSLLQRSIWSYISERSQESLNNLTKDNALSVLAEKGLDESLALELIQIIDECEKISYSRDKRAAGIEFIEKTRSILEKLKT